MGNKNARSARRSVNLSVGGASTSSRSSGSTNGAYAAASQASKTGVVVKADATSSTTVTADAKTVQEPQLAFKSFKNGTLKTNNFVPVSKDTCQVEPFPAYPPTLNPKAVSFVPDDSAAKKKVAGKTKAPLVTKQPISQPRYFAAGGSSTQNVSAMRKPQMPLTSEQLQAIMRWQPTSNYPEFPTALANLPQRTNIGVIAPPMPVQSNNTALANTRQFNPPTGPSRPTKSWFRRADLGKKDLIITSLGIERNSMRVTQHYSQHGHPYWTRDHLYDPEKYDFLVALDTMRPEERQKIFADKEVEIFIDVGIIDQEAIDSAAVRGKVSLMQKGHEEQNGNTDVTAFENGETVHQKGKGKEKQVESQQIAEQKRTIIDTIKELGQEFVEHSSKITITLVLSADSSVSSRKSPSYAIITALVNELQSFTSITSLDVKLQLPASDARHDISMEQLEMVLPFYDLGSFLDWRVQYQKPYMQQPEEVSGWCIGYLDREMHKIMDARDKALKHTTFVRYSIAPQMPVSWKQQKAPVRAGTPSQKSQGKIVIR